MRTDAKIGLVAALVLVVLVIIYFAAHTSSKKVAENNALPNAQPALTETPALPGANVPSPSQTQPGLISLPTTATSMPDMSDQNAASMPSAATQTSNSTVALAPNGTDNGTDNTANNGGTGFNANSNATLTLPPISTGNANQTGNADTSGTASHRHHHHSRTLTLSAPHSGIYIVRKGDTLSSISRRLYGSARMIHALERANPGLDPRRMRVGQKIRLPRHSSINHSSSLATRHHHHYSSRSGTHGERIYVVRPGDDLSKIARKFYHNPGLWKRIYSANRAIIGSSPRDLRAGEKIVIPAR